MKKILTIALVAVFAMASFGGYAQTKQAKNAKSATAQVTFVTSIDCKNCVKKVEANLPYEKGIKDMKVTLADKTVWIKYDPSKTDKEKLAKAINKLGYEATEKETATE